MRRAADIRRSIRDGARIRFGGRNEGAHILIGPSARNGEKKRRAIEHRHGHKIPVRGVRQFLVQRRIDRHVGIADHQQLVSVRCSILDGLDGDEAARARTRIDQHLLRPRAGQLLGQYPCEHRGTGAR